MAGFLAALGSAASAAAPFLIGGGSSIMSSLMSYNLQKKLANLQYKHNLSLQENAQDWQENMSNTAFQRQVSDLRSAGLNPILATGMSGASTGSAGASSVSQGSAPQVDIADSIKTASELKRVNKMVGAEYDNLVSQTKSNSAQTQLALQQSLTEESKRTNMEFDNAMKDALKHKTDKETSWIDKQKHAEIYKATQDAELARAKASLESYNAQTARMKAESSAWRDYNSSQGYTTSVGFGPFKYSHTGNPNAYTKFKNADNGKQKGYKIKYETIRGKKVPVKVYN